jgi:hypothetical protein
MIMKGVTEGENDKLAKVGKGTPFNSPPAPGSTSTDYIPTWDGESPVGSAPRPEAERRREDDDVEEGEARPAGDGDVEEEVELPLVEEARGVILDPLPLTQRNNAEGTFVHNSFFVPRTARDNAIISRNNPRFRSIRNGIALVSWATGILVGGAAYLGGIPPGTLLFLIISGIGYIGTEIGGSLVVACVERLEGGSALALAERVGNVNIINNIGDRVCLLIASHNFGIRHATPTSIANSAERARIQDRGVEFFALLASLGYGGVSLIIRFGPTAELLNSLLIFTTLVSAGRASLVVARRGSELTITSSPRIQAISDPVAQRAEILRRTLYAPTFVGDFLTACGVVGRPLINAGVVLPLGVAARFLPQSVTNFVTGLVGVDIISDVQEAVVCAELLRYGVLPENIEEVARKKTLKYKIAKTVLYASIPFLIILIPYIVLYSYYSLAAYIPLEVSIISFAVLGGVLSIVTWCNFESLDTTIGALLSHCPCGNATENVENNDDPVPHAIINIDPIEQGTIDNVIATLQMVQIGITRQGRVVSVITPNQTSSDRNIQEVIELDAEGKIIFIQDHFDQTNFILPLNSGTTARDARGVFINMNQIDMMFDQHFGHELDHEAFAAAIQELRLSVVGITPVGRAIYVVNPGQNSRDRHVQRLLQLEQSGTRHCFVACAVTSRSVYCLVRDIFGSNNPTAEEMQRNIGRADEVFGREIDLGDPEIDIDEDDRVVEVDEEDRMQYAPPPPLARDVSAFHSPVEEGEDVLVFASSNDDGQDGAAAAVLTRREGGLRINVGISDNPTHVVMVSPEVDLTDASWRGGSNGIGVGIDYREPFAPREVPQESKGWRASVKSFVNRISTLMSRKSNNNPFGEEEAHNPSQAQAGVSRWSSWLQFGRSTFAAESSSNDEEERETSTTSGTSVATHDSTSSADEDESEEDGEGSEGEENGSGNDDSLISEDEQEQEKKSSATKEWYYDDRKSINGLPIDIQVFQEYKPKELELKLPSISRDRLENIAKEEHKSYREILEEILRDIEARSEIKREYTVVEQDEEEEREKTFLEKMLDSTPGILSKPEIPEYVDFTPPDTIKLTAMLPGVAFFPTVADISSYFSHITESLPQEKHYSFMPCNVAMTSSSISGPILGGNGWLSGGFLNDVHGAGIELF